MELEFQKATKWTVVTDDDGNTSVPENVRELAESAIEAWENQGDDDDDDDTDGVNLTTVLPGDVVVTISIVQGRAGLFTIVGKMAAAGEGEAARQVIAATLTSGDEQAKAIKASLPGMLRYLKAKSGIAADSGENKAD